MRILYVVHQYPPDHIGGTEIATMELAQAQAARGHQIAVFHPAGGQPGLQVTEEKDGLRLYRARITDRGPLGRFMATFRHWGLESAFSVALAREQPDIVHFQHLMGLPLSIVAQLRRSRIPYFLTLHDYWFICPNAQLLTNYNSKICEGPKGWLNCTRCAAARINRPWAALTAPVLIPLLAFRHRLLGKVLRGADWIVAPSKFVTFVATAHHAPQKHICVIPHGITPPIISVSSPKDKNLLHFTYIGGLSWQKGVHVLIEAFNEMPVNAVLEIFGDETVFPDYSRHLHHIARSPRIIFGGRLSRQEVWQTLTTTDVLVMPSLWFENSPLVIQEAFAAGVPVIASAIGALPEHVRHETDGLLVPPGDVRAWRAAMRRLVEEPEFREYLRTQVIPPPSLTEQVQALERLYIQH